MSGTRTFEIYGVRFGISGDEEIVSWIAEDFSFFEVGGAEALVSRLSFKIISDSGRYQEEVASSRALFGPSFKTRMCEARGWFRKRICDYGSGVAVSSRFTKDSRREFEIVIGSVGSTELAYEAVYSAVLSSVGEELDHLGFHRVHGLGIEIQDRSALLLLPSGGGKSAIAALLRDRANVKIFSDESPLLSAGRMYAYPVRGALAPSVAEALGVGASGRTFRRKLFAPKVLYAFDAKRIARPARPRWIFVGFRNGNGLIRASFGAKLAAVWLLLDCAVMGRGIAQMTEYMVRADSIWNLPIIAAKRLFAALSVVFGARCAWIDITADARQNAKVLLDFLEKSDF